jgi:hypothetical protein
VIVSKHVKVIKELLSRRVNIKYILVITTIYKLIKIVKVLLELQIRLERNLILLLVQKLLLCEISTIITVVISSNR